MATLSLQFMGVQGGVATRVTPNAGGDQIPNTGQEEIYLLNAGAAKTVTFVSAGTDPEGATWADLVVSLADGSTTPVLHRVRRLAPSRFNNTSDRVELTYSAVTGLTLFVLGD